jgi:outer membrane receptor for ferrienterochelin and colicin
VDFSNRLLSINAAPFILALVSGPAILTNVGSVKTDGVDVAATVHLGSHVSVYDAASYNRSIYEDDYTSGTTLVPTAGKDVPGDPRWLNKFIVSANFGPFEAQVSGDYVGKRYATYTNDQSVPSYFMTGLEASYRLPLGGQGLVKAAKLSINVTNLGDIKGVSAIVVGNATVSYGVYPIPPRMVFGTLTAEF